MTFREHIEYFDWLCRLVKMYEQTLYWREVLWILEGTEFIVVHPMDENRVGDAMDLRREYGRYDDNPASVLEVLIALARRGERDIMYDPDLGDRSSVWFWIMMENLGLDKFARKRVDLSTKNVSEIDEILEKFLMRRYDRDGNGSIFMAKSSAVNMKKEELWSQMNYFFDEFF